MSRVWQTGLTAAWGLIAACARPARPAADAAAVPAAEGEVADAVILERGPCFGRCPVYMVTLDRSGNVRFEGRRFVADSGVSSGTVPRARVDSLFVALERGYFAFADSYRSGDPPCERYATDLPTVITELRLGSRTKRIEHDRGCAGAPQALSDVEERIADVAGVRRWIGQ